MEEFHAGEEYNAHPRGKWLLVWKLNQQDSAAKRWGLPEQVKINCLEVLIWVLLSTRSDQLLVELNNRFPEIQVKRNSDFIPALWISMTVCSKETSTLPPRSAIWSPDLISDTIVPSHANCEEPSLIFRRRYPSRLLNQTCLIPWPFLDGNLGDALRYNNGFRMCLPQIRILAAELSSNGIPFTISHVEIAMVEAITRIRAWCWWKEKWLFLVIVKWKYGWAGAGLKTEDWTATTVLLDSLLWCYSFRIQWYPVQLRCSGFVSSSRNRAMACKCRQWYSTRGLKWAAAQKIKKSIWNTKHLLFNNKSKNHYKLIPSRPN